MLSGPHARVVYLRRREGSVRRPDLGQGQDKQDKRQTLARVCTTNHANHMQLARPAVWPAVVPFHHAHRCARVKREWWMGGRPTRAIGLARHPANEAARMHATRNSSSGTVQLVLLPCLHCVHIVESWHRSCGGASVEVSTHSTGAFLRHMSASETWCSVSF